ncbi:lysophospholipid acyltransferase family protein [Bdellovibrionota bacterium FG-1]
MTYLRLIFVLFWLILSCVFGLFLCLVIWGNPNIDYYFAQFYSWGASRICGIEVEVQGLEHLEATQPCVYVANHQSNMDMANLGPVYPHRTVVVGKKELLWMPFFGVFFVAAGNIVLDRKKRESAVADMKAAADQIWKRNISVWIFAEGTRNRTGELLMPFKKGAFYMAIQAGVPIVPIVCAPLKEVMSWKDRRFKPGKIQVRVLPPVDTAQWSAEQVDILTEHVRSRMLEAIRELKSIPRL